MQMASSSSVDTVHRVRKKSSSAVRRPLSQPCGQSSSLNVNMGISLDYASAQSTGVADSPLRYVSEVRRHISEQQRVRKHSHPHPPQPLQPAGSSPAGPSAVCPSSPKVRRESKSRCCHTAAAAVADSSGDSFDDCLEFAEQMDAVLAYYYADESSNGSVKVVEIFPVLRQKSSSPTHQTPVDNAVGRNTRVHWKSDA